MWPHRPGTRCWASYAAWLAIPGARGFFSSLQLAFKQREAKHQICIDKNMCQQLSDFVELAARQTHARGGSHPGYYYFCRKRNISPILETVQDPVLELQEFANRYRDGRIASRQKPVRAGTVEDALRRISQTLSSMGTYPDYWLRPDGTYVYRLDQLFKDTKKEDDPKTRVLCPLPLSEE